MKLRKDFLKFSYFFTTTKHKLCKPTFALTQQNCIDQSHFILVKEFETKTKEIGVGVTAECNSISKQQNQIVTTKHALVRSLKC